MIALTSPYLWYITRATGIVALILFTLVVSLGMLVANRIGGTVVGRFEINELHRSVSMVALVFLVIHILTTMLDSFVATGWFSAIIPFASAYRRVPVAIGAVAFDLILAVWVSSLLKVRVKNATWRYIHWLSWLAFASAIAHAYLTGTDTKSGAGLAVVALCALTVLGTATWRYLARPTRAAGRTALSPLAAAKKSPPVPRPPGTGTGTRAGTGTSTDTRAGTATSQSSVTSFPRSPSPRNKKGR